MASPNHGSGSAPWYGNTSTGRGLAQASSPRAAKRAHPATNATIGPRTRWTRRPVYPAIEATSLSSTSASRASAGPTRRIAISGTSARVTSPASHGQRSVGIRERRRFSVKASFGSPRGPPPVSSLTSRRKPSLAPSSRYSCA